MLNIIVISSNLQRLLFYLYFKSSKLKTFDSLLREQSQHKEVTWFLRSIPFITFETKAKFDPLNDFVKKNSTNLITKLMN